MNLLSVMLLVWTGTAVLGAAVATWMIWTGARAPPSCRARYSAWCAHCNEATMNEALQAAAAAVRLMDPAQAKLRLAFGLACAERVAHLLEDPRAKDGLEMLRAFVEGRSASELLEAARAQVEAVARSHPGSRSIDGAAHAAVSATHAVANALAGRALDAASYAAYAAVYAYGGYAVTDPSSFESEFQWQLRELARLAAASREQG